MANGYPFQMKRKNNCSAENRACCVKADTPISSPPAHHAHETEKTQKKKNNFLASMGISLDNDTMILLAFLWMLIKEDGDKPLLLALCYILM